MKHALRGFIALGLLLAVLLAAYGSPAWASTQTEKTGVSQALDRESVFSASTFKGSVKPPRTFIDTCTAAEYKDGKKNWAMDGIVVVNVTTLTDGYCLKGYVAQMHAVGRLPQDAGKFLTEKIVSLKYYLGNTPVAAVPPASGNVQVCYAVPPNASTAQIYFYVVDPGEGQPVWVPLTTTLNNTTACASALSSGYYAIVGK